MACNKSYLVSPSVINFISIEQEGVGRRKCAVCVYDVGYNLNGN